MTGDGSLELYGDYRRGCSRKPPRPHWRRRRRRCASEDVGRRSGGMFQKLDREMGLFVQARKEQVVASEAEESSSVRGVRHGVKWKCGWMFEQDSLYWETVRRQDVSGGEEKKASWRRAGREKAHSAQEDPSPLRYHCSTDHESVSSGLELHLRRRTHASRRRAAEADCQEDGRHGEERPREKGWPAVLKAKCEVLQMEKELADQKFQQQCVEMAQAAEMAHCLRASVQTILETAKRGTVSAPCTPGRVHFPEDGPCVKQRIQQLQKVNVQRDLQEQAKNFQDRIDNLRLRSQVRSTGDSRSFRPKDRLFSKTPQSSTSTTTQALTSDGEDWTQVQEVLKQLRGKTGSLQVSCENWEKRALFAESKAASLQIEEEKWRLEAQRSEARVRELERELVQVRATLEEVRNRHALEQSRLLGSGSNHGYTLVLQPIVTNSPGCSRCHVSADSESCTACGGHHHPARVPGDNPEVPKEATFENGDEVYPCDEPAEPNHPSPPVEPSPEGELLSETTTSTGQGNSSSRHRYEGVEPEEDDEDEAQNAENSSATINVHEAKSEVEKSLSQKWFKQRPVKSRRPGGCEITVSETRNPNLGNSPIPEKRGHGGRVTRKPGPVYAGSMRVSPPSHLHEKRVPLREIKCNNSAGPNDAARSAECS